MQVRLPAWKQCSKNSKKKRRALTGLRGVFRIKARTTNQSSAEESDVNKKITVF